MTQATEPIVDDDLEPDEMVIALLQDSVLFVSGADTKVTLFVGFNDVFAWATADGEDCLLSELPNLYKYWQADKVWGVTQWASVKRNIRPMWCVQQSMIDAGSWTAEMEALPPREDEGTLGNPIIERYRSKTKAAE